MKPIYLDYNATTPIHPKVAKAMLPYLSEYFGNPSSSHWYGKQTRLAVETARKQIAEMLKCTPDEICFTSGGSEANNLAIKGFVLKNREKGNHIITSQVEHPAVLDVCSYLETLGFEVTYLPVDKYGSVILSDFEQAIKPETILVSIMQANNEVGTIQPIKEISEIAHKNDIIVHTDSAQAVGKIEVDTKSLKADMISIAGHKLYAPKGVGVLYLREGIELQKQMHGANHEQGLRAGTENVLEIVGLGKACELVKQQLENNYNHSKKLRDMLENAIKDSIKNCIVHGHPEKRLPNTLSISFPGIQAQQIMAELEGIACSPGAACHSDKVIMSHVLKAMAVSEFDAMGTIRFSTGLLTTEDEIKNASMMIIETIQHIS